MEDGDHGLDARLPQCPDESSVMPDGLVVDDASGGVRDEA